jgi:hypothetical protein
VVSLQMKVHFDTNYHSWITINAIKNHGTFRTASIRSMFSMEAIFSYTIYLLPKLVHITLFTCVCSTVPPSFSTLQLYQKSKSTGSFLCNVL